MPAPRETLLCQYRYDPLDRLTGHAQPNTPTLQRFYCKSRLATEIQGTTGHSIVQHDDLLLAQLRRQDDAIDTTLLVTDQQRSVLQTLEASQQRQPIAYSPYGHRPAESGLTSLLGFNGERRDPVTGHYLLGNGYRAFNPVLMRFNSPDSLSPFEQGGLNSYAYCFGDPITWSDSTGHSPILASLMRYIESRTIQGIKPNQFLTLNTGISRDKAINLRSILQTDKQKSKAITLQQDIFETDYRQLFPLSNKTSPPSLKNLTIQNIIDNKISTHRLPPSLQLPDNAETLREVLGLLRDRRHPEKIIFSTSNLQLLPSEINKSRDPLFREIANQYRDKMLKIRSPEGELQSRALATRYFVQKDIF
ncbi:RHS repeat-associated core domain-containing protein [Pseudomonas sp. N3-W]|uniref:RHS repeat-associated core domain-containing protein n=1 Tax=Pseudomonas sp. N3-W TaxID=2975049 RepID=UPI00217EC244|nr:RHS repeat-associated core domain-containing protein [Pseudomonas sp. N3-W]UWF50912.1 RHS repeat-associated core domain-containing protein [Pseudomonas sp. N3-W]